MHCSILIIQNVYLILWKMEKLGNPMEVESREATRK